MTTPRRRAREFALQGMYQWQYTGEGAAQVLKNLSELEEFAQADQEFLGEQLRGTIEEAAGLRSRIEPLADRKWDDLSPIERGILMLAAWELMHKQDIPYRVTINEAIELGKRFSTAQSGAFINGILDRIRRDLGRTVDEAPAPQGEAG